MGVIRTVVITLPFIPLSPPIKGGVVKFRYPEVSAAGWFIKRERRTGLISKSGTEQGTIAVEGKLDRAIQKKELDSPVKPENDDEEG